MFNFLGADDGGELEDREVFLQSTEAFLPTGAVASMPLYQLS